MDARKRIEAMLEDGRITSEEAERLLSVLDDVDQVSEEVDEVGRAAEAASAAPFQDPPPAPAASAAPPAPPEPQPAAAPPSPAEPDRPASSTDADRPQPSGEAAQATRDEAATSATPDASAAASGAPAGQAAVSSATPNAAAPASTDTAGSRQPSAKPQAPAGLRWLSVEMVAGDVDIIVDRNLTEPELQSDGSLVPSEDGARIQQFAGVAGESIFDRIVGGFRRSDVEVHIPAGWGVRLDVKAGDITIRGPIAYLTGNFLAGDLSAEEVGGVDLSLAAGDIDLGLRLVEGSHRLNCTAGDVDIHLRRGSSVRVTGQVNIGDASLDAAIKRSSKGLGSSFEGTIGAGEAELQVHLATGDLSLTHARD